MPRPGWRAQRSPRLPQAAAGRLPPSPPLPPDPRAPPAMPARRSMRRTRLVPPTWRSCTACRRRARSAVSRGGAAAAASRRGHMAMPCSGRAQCSSSCLCRSGWLLTWRAFECRAWSVRPAWLAFHAQDEQAMLNQAPTCHLMLTLMLTPSLAFSIPRPPARRHHRQGGLAVRHAQVVLPRGRPPRGGARAQAPVHAAEPALPRRRRGRADRPDQGCAALHLLCCARWARWACCTYCAACLWDEDGLAAFGRHGSGWRFQLATRAPAACGHAASCACQSHAVEPCHVPMPHAHACHNFLCAEMFHELGDIGLKPVVVYHNLRCACQLLVCGHGAWPTCMTGPPSSPWIPCSSHTCMYCAA